MTIVLTKAQRTVLTRLATGKWTLDCYGRNGLRGAMSGPGGVEAIVSSKTMDFLWGEGLVRPDTGASDFVITNAGREALSQ